MEFKLIIKKLNNTITKDEGIVFDNWYQESKIHRNYFDKVKANYQNDVFNVDIEKGWQAISKKIESPKSKKHLYWKYAVAASLVTFLVFNFVFNKKDALNSESNSPVIVNQNIKAGTDRAILTLGDGTNLVLEKGKELVTTNLTTNGTQIIYNETEKSSHEVDYNYLTIPRGAQFFVELSDGTKVWLNSESKLKYPVNFSERETRQVELVYGEAYFEVSPSTLHNGTKFIVNNDNQKIEVLGTEFNVKAYASELIIATTLVHGKVNIKYQGEDHILLPNQQSKLDINSNTISIDAVDVYHEISWKNGVFSFNNKSLKEIMVVLSRWYDFEVVFKNKQVENEEFVGVLGKNDKIEDILLNLKNLGIIKDFKFDDKKIFIE